MTKFAIVAALLVSFALSRSTASAWVCGEKGVDPNHCITATPTKSNTPTTTTTSGPTITTTPTSLVTSTTTSTATQTPTPSGTPTPVVITVVVTATPPPSERRTSCAEGNTICGPNTGSGGYLR